MKEPTKYSMSTGLPETKKDREVKRYPLPSIEQELHNVIQNSKEWKSKYEQIEKEE